jgi:hypothetical protein
MPIHSRATEREGFAAGSTLVEILVAVSVGAALLVGVLAVWDFAARTNKSEIDISDAQGSVRYGLHQISRVVAMAGAGGLFVTQAVLLRPDPDLGGISVPPDGDYDNIVGGTVTNLSGARVPIRPGTDLIEVRGVFFSPLLGLDSASGCGACTGVSELTARAVTETGHINEHPARRPQFSLIDAYTQGVSDRAPVFVLVSEGADLHPGCSTTGSENALPPQPPYAVGLLTAPTALAAAGTFGRVDFSNALARELTTEDPRDRASPVGPLLHALRRTGVLDDLLFFVDDSDPRHPVLAQAVRRGSRFDVTGIAEDIEDLQVSYGVDGLYGSDSVLSDGSLGRLVPPTPEDPDPDASTQRDADEWAPNVEGERLFETAELQSVDPPPAGFPHTGDPSDSHCPRVRALKIGLVAKSHDPDPSYRGPDSAGIRSMNSPPQVRVYPTPPSAPRFRRRLLTITVALRNFGFAG